MKTLIFAIYFVQIYSVLEFLGQDHFLLAAEAPTTQAAGGVAVLGVVCLPDGVTPLPKVSVSIYDSNGLLQAPQKARMNTLTNTEGAFFFADRLSDGNYTIRVIGDNASLIVSQAVHVAKDQRHAILLQLRADRRPIGASPFISGKTVGEESTGTLVLGTVCLADAVTPVPEPTVCVYDASGIAQIPARAKIGAISNGIGAFAFNERLKPGNYTVEVVSNYPTSPNNLAVLQPLVITKKDNQIVMLELKAAPGSLRGTVYLPSGTPAGNALVGIFNKSRTKVYFATSDKNGHYEIKIVLADDYTAVINSDPAHEGKGKHLSDVEEKIVIADNPLSKDFTLHTTVDNK